MKKIFGIIALIGTLSFSESLTSKVEIGASDKNLNVSTSQDNKSNPKDEKKKEEAKRKEAIKNLDAVDKNIKDTGQLSKNFDFDKMFDDIDNYWEKISDGTDNIFKNISIAGDVVTGITGIAGSFPGFGGISVIGTNIQAVLQKILAMKNRVDQLKQYKRYIDSVRSLGKSDVKNLTGVYNTLNSLSSIINEGVALTDMTKGFANDIKSADLSTGEGWELLLTGNKKVQEQNNNAYDKVAGEDYKLAIDTINRTKKKLQQINPKNEVQNLQQLNGQMNILIQVMEQLLNNQSASAATMIQAENKRLEEEIAAKEIKKAEVERLREEIKEANRLVKEIKLGTRFVGSVNGNR
ncbi:hypothetical protein [Streptobacillus moniliformis]|uniref:hypothetical protein n=1 Tax=Streptobacillus moniliformis TaxID=34105 RepID=UPI0007E2F5FA|nr:hypothetical protein [Streptobacillus moniliformis]QXW66309.1 trichohyalin-plectin-homology domain domain-containing protein [Streptobacillus moniliformis]